MTLTAAALGEDALLGRILPLLGTPAADVRVGAGDDSAVVTSNVVSTDMLVEGRDFRRHWSDGYALGIKAAAQNLADVAAMGARPVGLVLALGLPGPTPVAWVENLCRGMADEAARAGCSVVGGDLSEASEAVISVTALGALDGLEPVLRSGARPGDIVALAGTVGRASAGLELLLEADAALEKREPLGGSREDLVAAQLAPQPDYAAGRRAAAAGAHAMIDASDGLLKDLGRLARSSGVAIDVDPESPALLRLAAEIGEHTNTPWTHVLAGGEDHGLLACFDSALPLGWKAIGRVGAGAGVTVAGRPQGPGQGFSHFAEGT